MSLQPSGHPTPSAPNGAARSVGEPRLHATEERYRQIVETTSDGVWTIDAEGKTDYVNRRAAELLGYTVEEMLGRSTLDFLFPEDVPEGLRQLQMRKEGQGDQREARLRRKDGSELWVYSTSSPFVDDRGVYHGALAIFADVTERKRAEEALRQSEDRYRRFFFADDLTGDFLVTIEGRLLLCNASFARMFGYDSAEAIMADPAFSVFPEVQEMETLLATLRAQQKVAPHERHLRAANGKPITVIESLVGLFEAEGTLSQVQGYLLDITERKQMEARMLQAERLAAIGQLVAGVAHESGNALQGSQACLERLAWRVQDRPEALELVDRIQQELDRLYGLYEDIRGFAAPLRLAPALWDLGDVWRQAWAKLAPARAGRKVVLQEPELPADLNCEVDAFRMQQVFHNILENSLAACSGPVRIVIEATPADLEGRPALRLAVRDNGPGLNPEQRERLFEPFYTTKTRGTGLGMTITKRIVEAHGGWIAVGDRQRSGTEIVITLPRRQP